MNQTATQLNQELDSLEWPRFDSVSLDESSDEQKSVLQCDITINADLSYFDGHFPEQPVVPGVVQVHWVGELAQRYFACQGFSALKKVKFNNTILPTAALQLVLKHDQKSHQISFEYRDSGQRYSSGVISFQ